MTSAEDRTHHDLRTRNHRLYDGPIAFSDWTGLRYLRSAPDETHMAMPFAPRLADAAGVIGPGIVATLFDTCAGQVAISHYGWQAQVATISLQPSFVAPPPPGAGLLASGRVVAADDGRVSIRVRVTADTDPAHLVCETSGRMIVTLRLQPRDDDRTWPTPEVDHPGPFLGPDDLTVRREAGGVTAHIARRPHYMGNTTRGALHGGMVAASLLETIAHLPAHGGGRVAPLDVQIDYLRPARDVDLVVRAEMHLSGSRVGFCSAFLEQDLPGRGPSPIARLTGTVAISRHD